MKAKIKSIDVRGFRSFGSSAQPLRFSSELAVVWGPNSQGKTSLSEALEFLFTGNIVRRELLASAKDEFADSLRHVHLEDSESVYVEAELDYESTTHTVRRTLKSDYGKKGGCESLLEVDGDAAAEKDLARVGIVLSQPPLAAPVLMQHTLPYVFSVGPQDRATYFKALLDVGDLDVFVDAVVSHGVDLSEPKEPVLSALRRCAAHEAMSGSLSPLMREKGRSLDVAKALGDAAAALLTEAGEDVPADPIARFEALAAALRGRQAETFPLQELGAAIPVMWKLEDEEFHEAARVVGEQRKKLDSETERLIPILEAVLRVPALAELKKPVDCPLCQDGSLRPDRVESIRSILQDTRGFRDAESNARDAVTSLGGTVKEAGDGFDRALPSFVKLKGVQRKGVGLDVGRARRLAGTEGEQALSAWLAATRALLRARRALLNEAKGVTETLSRFAADPGKLDEEATTDVKAALSRLAEARTAAEAALASYKEGEDAVLEVLPSAVAKESKTEGWQDLVDLQKYADKLKSALVEWESRTKVAREVDVAVKVIRDGMGAVFDEKIRSISGEVERWWNLLRPGEPTFFSGVQRRKKASRTIDFKAALSPHKDRSDPKTRDAVAVLSYSQLQCLGLSVFLARATREGVGFIVLDDPVLAGDEDHRPNFVHAVVPELMKDGAQVIVMTQDQVMRSDLLSVYSHLNVDCFHVTLEPASGTSIDKTSDGLEALLSRAKPYVGSVHLHMRKTAARILREAAERLCKEIVVQHRRANGETEAVISEYVGEKGTLGKLLPLVQPLLKKPDELGKLEWIRKNMNPGGHDAPVPSGQDTVVVQGYLRSFKRDYL